MASHLVTGGSGFLGNLIAHRLVERGEQVRVLDVWDAPDRDPRIEFVRCDIRDEPAVAEAMAGVDVVHHNVALVPLSKSGDEYWEVNVLGSRVAAEQAVRAGVRHFVHMSSSAIFGVPRRCPIDARTTPAPVEVYGRAKLAGEVAVRETLAGSRTSLVVIRPRTILGSGRLGIFQVLFDWIRSGRDVYTIGPGTGLFQFVHADDLMSAYMLALDRDRPGVYNVGTDRFGTLREALEHLVDHAGTASRVRRLPERATITALRTLDRTGLSPLAPWHYLTYHKPFWFDVSALHDLGWRVRYSNDEMLAESYDSFLTGPVATTTGSPHRRAVSERALSLVRRIS